MSLVLNAQQATEHKTGGRGDPKRFYWMIAKIKPAIFRKLALHILKIIRFSCEVFRRMRCDISNLGDGFVRCGGDSLNSRSCDLGHAIHAIMSSGRKTVRRLRGRLTQFLGRSRLVWVFLNFHGGLS